MVFCKWSRLEAGRCSFKTYYELAEFWQELPPAEIQLRNIAMALGITPKSTGSTHSHPAQSARKPAQQTDAEKYAGIMEAKENGMHIFEGPLDIEMSSLLADLPLT